MFKQNNYKEMKHCLHYEAEIVLSAMHFAAGPL